MTEKNDILPDWIERQATLGANVQVDGERTEENFYRYLLTVCCPLIFESYAILLHPYWINLKVKDLITSGLKINENQVDENDYKRINWIDFFKLYGYNFNLKTANQTKEKISQQLLSGETDWPVYIWFPAEGSCETEELKFIFSKLADFYGDVEANFFYCLLKTEKWDKERIFKGKLSNFDELEKNKDLRDNPTAIFPDNKTWCIISDYDLPFTYIGGSKKFIDNLTNNKKFDIYEIEPIFNEKEKRNIKNSE